MKIFTADKSFIEYITFLGFVPKEVDSDKKYYVNKKNKQIKIDYEKNEISFVNVYGFSVKKSAEISAQDLDIFNKETDDKILS